MVFTGLRVDNAEFKCRSSFREARNKARLPEVRMGVTATVTNVIVGSLR